MLAGCGDDASSVEADVVSGDGLTLSAGGFEDNGSIPDEYGCKGENRGVNPELSIGGIENGMGTYALLMRDTDGNRHHKNNSETITETGEVESTTEDFVPEPGWHTHWLLWNIPPSVDTIPRDIGLGKSPDFADGVQQGVTSTGQLGYQPPCPPEEDEVHRYKFTLYRVQGQIHLEGGVELPELVDVLNNSDVTVIDDVTMSATYTV
jgi:Raf kinase inhibitor-like YbhB/YbcL family protein